MCVKGHGATGLHTGTHIVTSFLLGCATVAPGGDAKLLLEETSHTFWCPHREKEHVVVFAFPQNVKLERFFYMPTKQPVRQPRVSVLKVSETRTGPWTEVARLTAQQQLHQIAPVQTAKFAASGRYWRWEILSRYGKHGMNEADNEHGANMGGAFD